MYAQAIAAEYRDTDWLFVNAVIERRFGPAGLGDVKAVAWSIVKRAQARLGARDRRILVFVLVAAVAAGLAILAALRR